MPRTPRDAADTLCVDGEWVDPLWRVRVELSPLEQELLRTWWVRRLGFVAHAGAASICTTQTYSRLEHSLGVLALAAHFAPDDATGRAAALLHDVGHLPLSHTVEGLAGLDHHALGRERIRSLAPVLERHGLAPEHVIAAVDGQEVSCLHGAPGRLRLDHLDSFVRSGQAHGRTDVLPADLLLRLRLVDGAVDTDVDTAAELARLITAEARSQRAPTNVVATAVTRALAGHLLERRDPAEVATMTDHELWSALAHEPDLAHTADRLRRSPYDWVVEERTEPDTDERGHRPGNPTESLAYEIRRSYLDLPGVDGQVIAQPVAIVELERSLPVRYLVHDRRPAPTRTRPAMTMPTDRAASVVLGADATVLVIRRIRDGRRYCVLPGGGLESGEEPREAALRELGEETGLRGRVERRLAVWDHPDRRTHYFLVAAGPGEPRLGGPERERQSATDQHLPTWIPLTDLDVENLQPRAIRAMVRDAADQRDPTSIQAPLVTLFDGTADYYRRYRSGVSPQVARVLDDAAPHGEPRRLLDLGTGTGFVVEALRGFFDDIIGVDADPALLEVARDTTVASTGEQIRFELATAETFTPPTGWTADLVTICRAFHWMDQPLVLDRLDAQVAPAGVVAVFGDNSIWAANAPWKSEIQAVLAEFLGDRRRAGSGTYQRPAVPYTDYLEQSAFSAWRRVVVPVRRERTLDSVIGYLHSTSFAAPHLFGDRLDAFDRAIAERLVPLAVDGVFVDDNAFDVLLATRRQAASDDG